MNEKRSTNREAGSTVILVLCLFISPDGLQSKFRLTHFNYVSTIQTVMPDGSLYKLLENIYLAGQINSPGHILKYKMFYILSGSHIKVLNTHPEGPDRLFICYHTE